MGSSSFKGLESVFELIEVNTSRLGETFIDRGNILTDNTPNHKENHLLILKINCGVRFTYKIAA